MDRYIRDDIRYMPHEVRVAEGFMAPVETKKVSTIETCRCGKTVLVARGVRVTLDGVPVECPRDCGRS